MAKLSTSSIPALALCGFLTACSQPFGSVPDSTLTVAEARSLPELQMKGL